MKKTAAMLAVLAMSMSLAACGNNTTTGNTTTGTTARETTKEATTAAKETTKEAVKETTKETTRETTDEVTQEDSSEGRTTDRDGVDISDTDDRNDSKGVLDDIGDDIMDGITGIETR